VISEPIVSYKKSRAIPWDANCPMCGALLYSAHDPKTFDDVLNIERPFCFHCGTQIGKRAVVPGSK